MAFKKTFEKQVNRNMQDDGERGQSSNINDMDIKTQPTIDEEEEEDYEKRGKADVPPRFSTLFPPAPRVERSESPRREYYPAPQKRKSGVWLPWSIFILLAVMLFLESTVLFTYTVIGLYNNTPSRVLAWAGPGTTYSMNPACDPQKITSPQAQQQQPPSVNFAPNIVIPQAAQPQPQPPMAVTVTVTQTPTPLPTTSTTSSTTSSTSSTTSSSSTTSVDPTSAAALVASEVASMLASAKSTASSSGNGVLTISAPGPVVTETKTIPPTSSPSPSPSPATTTTSVVFVTAGVSDHTTSPSSTENATSSPSVNTFLPAVVINQTQASSAPPGPAPTTSSAPPPSSAPSAPAGTSVRE